MGRWESVLMMFGCCKTCMGCHEAGTGGCHVSRWCDIVTWHRMLPRTLWWYMAIVKWEEIILIAVSSSPHNRHTQPREIRDSQRMGSWAWRQDVLLSSKLIWTCHLCLGPSNISCYMTPIQDHHSLLQSRPWFFCRWAKFKLGVGLVRWEMSFLTHHDIICRTQSPMSLCLPIFAELVIWSD